MGGRGTLVRSKARPNRIVAAAVVIAAATLTPLLVASRGSAASGIHLIQHVVIITQENRSFDDYFGTYPGADGIPMANGQPTVCSPDPVTHTCVAPYPDHSDVNGGGPHGVNNSINDINGGAMNGFETQARDAKHDCPQFTNPACSASATPDVMGYHTQSDIPNYWSYAQHFVLQDHMYEANDSWSLPSHLFEVSGWSAKCTTPSNPLSCKNNVQSPTLPPVTNSKTP